MPWNRLIAVIELQHPTSGRDGHQPIRVPLMLRMYCLKQSGAVWPTRRWNTRCTTVRRCATSQHPVPQGLDDDQYYLRLDA